MDFDFRCIDEKLDYSPDSTGEIKSTGIDPEFVIARNTKER